MKKPLILLFTPGNRKDFIQKASKYRPDGIIVDLEDSVPIQLKEKVRGEIAAMIPTLDVKSFVRVNGEDKYLEEDLKAIVSKDIEAILIPKVESVDLIKKTEKILGGLEKSRNLAKDSVKMVIGIETPLGVIRCFDLASSSPRIIGVTCASGEEGDLQTNLKCGFSGLYYARSKVLLDSRAAGMEYILDGVFSDIHDDAGLEKDCVLSKELGYDGRALIHPRHIAIARKIYSPSEAELDHYRRMIQAFEEAEARGIAAITFEGKMVDYAMIKKAKDILSS
jgi:citrate lyase subunit beta/citryl-CoA lyase